MYLKSLELFGFKSFAPRTLLEFHRGVTCVVGPNGCGKSNVLDAIRWVLGEQSAKALRGGEMADVIFSGTDSRSALGMAEVSMTFADCEHDLGVLWNEVTITRRVFRDGGSEYLLNKTPCRLKDIHQMFMDTGVGRSAYSIMEQGKIDQILSSRPEDRRSIFEEAAGITRFKAQKKEAMRKLEATEANLVRLDDIVKEVKRQIGSMQRQAGKARRYQSLLAELKTFETHLAHRQWQELVELRGRNEEELGGLTERIGGLQGLLDEGEAGLASRRAALNDLEERLEISRRAAEDLRSRISNHESRLVFNTERMREFGDLSSRYRSEAGAAEVRRMEAEHALRSTDAELEEITANLAVELRNLEGRQATIAGVAERRMRADHEIQGMGAEVQRIEGRLSGLRQQMSSVAQQRDGAEARLGVLLEEADALKTAEAAARGRIVDARKRAEAAAETVRLSEKRLGEMDAEAGLLRGEAQRVDGVLRGVERQIAEQQSRLDVFSQLAERGEGFSAGTKAVLAGLDDEASYRPAILGALADWIEVDPEYVPAVEAALGANLEAIVMRDTAVAERIIRTLTDRQMGKAVLALGDLDHAFEHVHNEKLVLPEGAVDWLINKIRPKPEVQRLIERLVNFTVLIPDVATALRLFPRKGWMMVTLRGEVLTGDGMLHGGVEPSSSVNSVLERKNQVQELERSLAGLREEQASLTTRREAAEGKVAENAVRADILRAEMREASVLASTVLNEVGLFEREVSEAVRRREATEGEAESVEARRAEAEDRLLSMGGEEYSLIEQTEQLQVRREEAVRGLEALRVEEAEAIGALNELKIRVATERQRHSSLHHQRQPMEARIRELEETICQKGVEADQYAERIVSTEGENAELQQNLVALRSRVSESEVELTGLMAERSEIAESVQRLADELREHRHQLGACLEQRSRIEVRQSQAGMKVEVVEEHIRKRYQIELSGFQRDLYALRVAYRDAIVRQSSRSAAEVVPEESEEGGSVADVLAAAEAAAERVQPEPEVAVAVGEGEVDSAVEEIPDSLELDWNRIELLVRELDRKLDSMGAVNLDAIQEFEELEQRHAFLDKQYQDLLTSKEELLSVIAKINTTTKQLFAETFEKIRVNFQEMFGELFGGGRANLVLTESDDPLESGIEIIAKPPGKQLQSITLMSGGEKTMTAVALLFSIYMVKPSPFCVLDEMDAPLDESNISRFIRILDRFVGQSQFVVISHNKRTIARADAIYGVTMEEHGVSRLVGVKFTKRDESAASSDVVGGDNPDRVLSVAESFGKSPRLASEDREATGA
jgi:chromosome segregation protein